MRKVTYSVGASLDGYIAAPDGSVDWLNRAAAKAQGEDFGLTKFFGSIDTVLMGRKTYEHAVGMGMPRSGYPEMRNIILSRTLSAGHRDGVEFVSANLDILINKLRCEEGKGIWLCGGGELAREALKLGLLDEITVGIAPVLIGAGLPTFPSSFPETALELLDCKQYKGGFLGLTYRVAGSRAGTLKVSKRRKTEVKSAVAGRRKSK